jgi:hypothetical protein
MIMSDEVAHEDIDDVIVNRDGATEARHRARIQTIPINGQRFLRLTIEVRWTLRRASS